MKNVKIIFVLPFDMNEIASQYTGTEYWVQQTS